MIFANPDPKLRTGHWLDFLQNSPRVSGCRDLIISMKPAGFLPGLKLLDTHEIAIFQDK